MTQERNRIRAELEALIEIETDPAKWIAMKDFLEALDDVDDFVQVSGGEPMPHTGRWPSELVEKPELRPTDDGDSTAERFSDNPIDRIFDPPALTTEQLRKLAVLVGAQDAVDAVDRGDIDAAKSILAQLGHYGASVPLPPGL
jgi:hypothetical protein